MRSRNRARRLSRRHSFRRGFQPRLESLEDRRLMAIDWRNPVDATDVNADAFTSPIDALLIINDLNQNRSHPLLTPHESGNPYLDTSGDNVVSPIDALLVINALNERSVSPYVLRERADTLATEATVTITTGQVSGARTYRFSIDSVFDTSDTASTLKDLLAVYIVDPSIPTQTLLDRGVEGTAVLNLSENGSDYVPGLIRWDGRIVEVDLTELSELDTAMIKFQLLNQDRDNNSQVTIRPLSNSIDTTTVAPPLFESLALTEQPGPALNTANLNVVTQVQLEFSNVRFDQVNRDYAADLRLTNGGTAVGRNVIVTFPNLPAGATLANASGSTAQGVPYLSFLPAIDTGGLASGDRTRTIPLIIEGLANRPFILAPQILAGVNHAPQFPPIPDILALPGNTTETALTATDEDGDLLSYTLLTTNLPNTTLTAGGRLRVQPRADQVGEYTAEVAASDGVLETRRTVSIKVLNDAVTTTRVSGKILKTNGQPLQNLRVEIGTVQGVTAADGSFLLDLGSGPVPNDTLRVRGDLFVGASALPFVAEKLSLILDHDLFMGVNNVVERPIYLPELNVAGGTPIDPTKDTLAKTNSIDNASVLVRAGTLMNQQGTAFTGTLSITEVPRDLTPAALPAGVAPDLVVTIQPGEMVFSTPAPLTLPNRAGYAPGTILDLWSINPVTGQFDKVGLSRVSADGSVTETISGGIRNSSWHYTAPPPPTPDGSPPNQDDGCDDCGDEGSAASRVKLHSGALEEDHFLAGYNSLGETRSLTLTYDSMRADVRPIVHFGIDNAPVDSSALMTARLEVSRGNTSFQLPGYTGTAAGLLPGEHFWRLPADGGDSDAALQADFSGRPTGVYNYKLTLGIVRPLNNSFVGSRSTQTGTLVVVNSINSAFGAGWGLNGLHEIVENPDGSLLFVDGDGGQLMIKPPLTPGGAYDTPPGDFSTLVKLGDGTFRRTMPDKTVYSFNSFNKIASRTDRNGNVTRYEYNSDRNLSAIVDPVGLRTQFAYSGMRVSSITDPAGRATRFEYDLQGNLTKITDPDGTSRQFEYDNNHLMVAERNKRGFRAEERYNFAGRLVSTLREDGAVQRFQTVQSQGLFPATATVDPSHPPTAVSIARPTAVYTDGNGNTFRSVMDNLGQRVSAIDGVGPSSSYTRGSDNLIAEKTTGRGNVTLYQYDANGNTISVRDEISGSSTLGTLASPGEVDVFTFQARAGESIFYDALLNPAGDVRVSITSPSGVPLLVDAPRGNDAGPFALSESGTYTVTFKGVNGATGDYELRFYLSQPQESTLILNTPLEGRIERPGERDVYQFDVTTPGQRIFIDSLGDFSGDIRYTLTDPNGTLLAEDVPRRDDRGSFRLGQTGTYTLAFRGIRDAIGDYRVQVVTPTSTVTPLELDATTSGRILTPGDERVYSFTGTTGQRVFYDSLLDTTGDIRVSLISPSGQRLIQDVFRRDNLGPFTLAESGNYQVVFGGVGDDVGDFSFRLLTPTTTTVPLSINSVIHASLDEPGEEDVYTIQATVGQQLFYDALSNPSSDLRVSLIGPDGQFVFENRFRRDDVGPIIVDTAGTYRFVFRGVSDAVGAYDFQLLQPTTTQQSLILDQDIAGALVQPGDIQRYSFTGAIGQRIFYDALTDPAGDLRVTLISPSGSRLIDHAFRRDNQGPFVLDEAGVYTLEFSGITDNVGPYSFRMTTPTESFTPLTFNTIINGQVSEPGERDYYTFSATIGQQLFYDALSNPAQDVRVSLIGPNGDRLINQTFRRDDQGLFTIPYTGIWQLKFEGVGDDVGDYSFRLLDAGSNGLTLGQTQSVNVAAQGVSAFHFTGAKGQRLQFDSQSNVSAFWSVYSSSSSQLAVSAGSQDFLVTLPHDGEYVLLISNISDAAFTMQLRVDDITEATVTPSGLGQTFSGSILPGETDSFPFQFNAGGMMAFDVQGVSVSQLVAQLVAPGGVEVFPFSSLSDRVFLAPRSGTYTLNIRGNTGSSTGNYQFVLRDMSASADSLSVNSPISGSISSSQEIDLFKFDGQAGQKLLFDSLQQSSFDIRVNIYAPSGELLLNSHAVTFNSTLLTLLSTGTYLVAVFGNSNAIDSYNFQITSGAVTTTATALDAPITGSITNPGEIDIYTFTGSIGQRIEIDTSTTDSLRYTLVSPSGELPINFANLNVDSQAFNLSETGTYRLLILGEQDRVGSYSLSVRASTITTTTASLGQSLTGQLQVPGELDIYAIAGTAGQRVIFDSNSASQIRYHLISPSGERIFFGADANSDTNGFQLKETGTYRLVIFAFGAITGPYDVRLAAATVTTVAQSLNQTISGQLEQPGELDLFSFAATVGQRVEFNALGAPGLRYHLVAPSGKLVINNGDANQDTNGFNLEESGSYKIVMFGPGDRTGPYSFRLEGASVSVSTTNLDADITGSITVPGDVDIYQLNVVAGQQFAFDSLGAPGLRYHLISPTGDLVINTGDANQDTFGFALAETGIYSIVVFGFSSTTGDYHFRPYGSTTLSSALTLSRAQSGAISEPGELDIYTFRATAGQQVLLDTFVTSGASHRYNLVSPTGRAIVFNGSLLSDTAVVSLAESGDYTLVVFDSAGQTGAYQFQLLDVTNPTLASFNRANSGRLTSGQATELWGFSGQAGQRFYLDQQSNSSNGTWLLQDSKGGNVFQTGLGLDGAFTVPATGTYRILVIGNGSTPVDYSFRLNSLIDTPQPYVIGNLINGRISQAGEQDTYTFAGGAGQRLWFDGIDGNVNLLMTLFSPSQKQLFQVTTLTEQFVRLPETGTYRLQISGANSVSGDYRLRVLNLEASPLLQLEQTVSGNLTSNSPTVAYRINATAGTRLQIDDLTTIAANGSWRVISPSGATLHQDRLGTDLMLAVPTTGPYILLLNSESTNTINYQFRVRDTSEPVVSLSGFGQTQAGTLSGNELSFDYTAPAGTIAYLDMMLNAGNGVSVKLEDAAGTALFTRPYGADPGPVLLPRSGTYKLKLSGTGDFRVRLDAAANLQALQAGSLVTGQISQVNQALLYRIPAAPGRRLYLDVATKSFANDLTLQLYSSDGQLVASEITSVGLSPITLLDNADYVLAVSAVQATGTVTLRSIDALAAGQLMANQPIDDSVAQGTEGDVYIIPAIAGQSITIDTGTQTFGVRRKLFNPANQLIEDLNIANDVSFTATVSGEYLLIVDGTAPVSDRYQLRLLAGTTSVKSIALDTSVSTAGGARLYAYEPNFNQLIKATDELGHQTIYDVDPLSGNTRSRTQVVGALGGDDDLVTTYTRNARGQITGVTDPMGRSVAYEFDSLGRNTRVIYAPGTADEAMESYEYDTVGNVISHVDPRGNRTDYSFDAMNRLLTVLEPDPDGVGPLARPLTTYTYDASGNRNSRTDARGGKTRWEFDGRSRVTKAIDELGNARVLTYDSADNVTSVVDKRGYTTRYEYDARNRLAATTDPTGARISMQYDLDNNLVTTIDPVGNLSTWQYDARSRITAVTDAAGFVESYRYDAGNRLVERTDRNGAKYREVYDDADRIVVSIDALGNTTRRSYDLANDTITVTDALGAVWKEQYDQRGRLIAATDSLGNVDRFEYDDVGNLVRYTDPMGFVTTMDHDPLNRLVSETNPAGKSMTYTYDAEDHLLSMTNLLGNTETYRYDALGRVDQTVDALGGIAKLAYDAEGYLIKSTDRLNRDTTYQYDRRGLLTAIVNPLGGTQAYAYDPSGRLVSETDELGRVTQYKYDVRNQVNQIIDALGGTQSFAYDGNGNMLQMIDELGRTTRLQYDALNRAIGLTDSLNGKASVSYDAVGNRIGMTDELGNSITVQFDAMHRGVAYTDAIGGTMRYEYNAVGDVTRTIDQLGHATRYEYDNLHRPTRMIDALGGVVEQTHDAQGNLTSVKDQLGRTTSFEYDKLDRRLKATDPLGGAITYEFDAHDRLTSFSDELNRKTQFTYDALDRPITVVDPLGGQSTFTYDAVGNRLTTADELGHQSKFKFDALNRLTEVTDAVNGITRYQYDAVGNLTRLTSAEGRVSTYQYDGLNRQVGMTDPLGHQMTNQFDAVGNLLSSTDALGRVQRYQYDNLYRVVASIDPAGDTTTYGYDAVSNLTSITDAIGNRTTYTFDALDRVVGITNSLGKTRSASYDAVGNRISMTDRNGRVINYQYDALNRMVQEDWRGSGGASVQTFTYTFDAASQVLTASDGVSRNSYTYDALGRKTTESNAGSAGVPVVVMTNTYDAASNKTSRTNSIGGQTADVIAFTYDNLDRLTRTTQSGTGVSAKRVDFTYDADHLMTGITRYSDLAGTQIVASTNMTHDLVGRITEIKHQRLSNVIADYKYTFDEVNRIVRQESNDGIADYTYDLKDQILGVDNSTGSDQAFTYDANGNRTSNGHTVGANNQLLSDGTFTYQYDDEGNRTRATKIATGEKSEYSWDYRGRLTEVVEKSASDVVTKRTTYTYDAWDRRIGKTVDLDGAGPATAQTTRFVYEGENIVLQFDGAGTLTQRYLHGPMVDQVLAQENVGTATHWLLGDHQNSIRDVISPTGTVLNHRKYDAYGDIVSETDAAIDVLYGYTGREEDAETGLNYYRFRYYDSAVGKFISEDPLGFGGGTNLSAYVGNDTINQVDPWGLQPLQAMTPTGGPFGNGMGAPMTLTGGVAETHLTGGVEENDFSGGEQDGQMDDGSLNGGTDDSDPLNGGAEDSDDDGGDDEPPPKCPDDGPPDDEPYDEPTEEEPPPPPFFPGGQTPIMDTSGGGLTGGISSIEVSATRNQPYDHIPIITVTPPTWPPGTPLNPSPGGTPPGGGTFTPEDPNPDHPTLGGGIGDVEAGGGIGEQPLYDQAGTADDVRHPLLKATVVENVFLNGVPEVELTPQDAEPGFNREGRIFLDVISLVPGPVGWAATGIQIVDDFVKGKPQDALIDSLGFVPFAKLFGKLGKYVPKLRGTIGHVDEVVDEAKVMTGEGKDDLFKLPARAAQITVHDAVDFTPNRIIDKLQNINPLLGEVDSAKTNCLSTCMLYIDRSLSKLRIDLPFVSASPHKTVKVKDTALFFERYGGTNHRVNQAALEDLVRQRGEGTIAAIRLRWKTEEGNIGHFMTIENVNGVPWWVDTQSGHILHPGGPTLRRMLNDAHEYFDATIIPKPKTLNQILGGSKGPGMSPNIQI